MRPPIDQPTSTGRSSFFAASTAARSFAQTSRLIGRGISRLVGGAVTAQVVGDDAEVAGERARGPAARSRDGTGRSRAPARARGRPGCCPIRRSPGARRPARRWRWARPAASIRCRSLRDFLQGLVEGFRPKDADDQDHERHGDADEQRHAGRAALAQKESDEQPSEPGADAAPAVDESDGAARMRVGNNSPW